VGAIRVEITDVQVNLCGGGDDRLRAYCAVVFDNSFVVHNVRVIEKIDGLLVAMPSRKLTAKCPTCHFKNPVDNSYCGNCGTHLRDEAAIKRLQRDTKVHFDVAHPINPMARQKIEQAVLAAYHQAREQSQRAESGEEGASSDDEPFSDEATQ
jgi:stage V sporulation protein G